MRDVSTWVGLGLIAFVLIFLIGRFDRAIYAVVQKGPKVTDRWLAFKVAMIPIAIIALLVFLGTHAK